jgi:hypothetical protein
MTKRRVSLATFPVWVRKKVAAVEKWIAETMGARRHRAALTGLDHPQFCDAFSRRVTRMVQRGRLMLGLSKVDARDVPPSTQLGMSCLALEEIAQRPDITTAVLIGGESTPDVLREVLERPTAYAYERDRRVLSLQLQPRVHHIRMPSSRSEVPVENGTHAFDADIQLRDWLSGARRLAEVDAFDLVFLAGKGLTACSQSVTSLLKAECLKAKVVVLESFDEDSILPIYGALSTRCGFRLLGMHALASETIVIFERASP